MVRGHPKQQYKYVMRCDDCETTLLMQSLRATINVRVSNGGVNYKAQKINDQFAKYL